MGVRYEAPEVGSALLLCLSLILTTLTPVDLPESGVGYEEPGNQDQVKGGKPNSNPLKPNL